MIYKRTFYILVLYIHIKISFMYIPNSYFHFRFQFHNFSNRGYICNYSVLFSNLYLVNENVNRFYIYSCVCCNSKCLIIFYGSKIKYIYVYVITSLEHLAYLVQ